MYRQKWCPWVSNTKTYPMFPIRRYYSHPTLFDEIDYDKLEKLGKTVDSLRKRYGMDSIMRASFIKQPIDHMSGGISREKRTVDYDRITIEWEGKVTPLMLKIEVQLIYYKEESRLVLIYR